MEWTHGLIYTTESSHFRIFHPKILDAYMLASRITYVHIQTEETCLILIRTMNDCI